MPPGSVGRPVRWQKAMNTRSLSRRPIVTVAVISVAVVAYFWCRARPYQDRFYSPNGHFYIQKYSAGGGFKVASVGGGSDMIDGYIRIYRSDDRLIHERFHTFIRDIRPVWDGHHVLLTGCAEGVISIPLPEAAE